MATVTRNTQTARTVARTAQPAPVQRAVQRPVAVPASTRPAQRGQAPGAREVAGFKIMRGVEIPAKKAFGGKRGVFNELFSQMEVGDYIEIEVESGKKNTSKMNSIYNAARRNSVEVTIRIKDAGQDGMGGILGVWLTGFKPAQ